MSKIPHFPLCSPFADKAVSQQAVLSPFDRQTIATVDCASEEIIEDALECAWQLYRNRSAWLSLEKRIEILEKAQGLLDAQQEFFALQAACEGGKPLIDSRAEVARAVDGIRICVDTLRTQAGRVIPMGLTKASTHRIAFTQHEPIGVVLAISAFNHPVNLIIHQICPAIATGCPVIIKPATDTPLSCFRIVSLFYEAGLPMEWCQALMVSDNQLAQKMASDRRLGFLSFIGSARVGWELRRNLAPGVRCSLEHGGVAPVLIDHDTDLATAIPIIVKGGFYHAGQVCVSIQRIYVEESIASSFVDQLVQSVSALKVGDPMLPETEVGPLIRPAEVDRVEQWIYEAVEKGASLRCGGGRLSDTLYQPTVLYNPPLNAKVSNEEVFGPVVCVYPFSDWNEAIKQANALPFAFQAAVFTKDLDRAMAVCRQLDASAVMVNDSTTFRVDGMPFAGLRQSGLGVGGIPYTMHDMQIEKMIVVRSPSL